MRVVPPPIPQPQGIPQISPQKPLESTIIEKEAVNSEIKPTENTSPVVVDNPPINKGIIIRKKRQYKAFIKLIKAGKYTSAVISSRILGVDKNTIREWSNTKLALQAMNDETTSFISDISKSKQWQAKAYLLDKLEDKDNIKDSTVNLTNLIQINTVSPSQE